MLINKLLLEHHFMIVRSTDLSYLRYIMDLGMMPIVRWMPDQKHYAYVILIYGTFSFMEKKTLNNLIRPLNIFEIKQLLFVIKYSSITTLDGEFFITNICKSYISINRNDLLC